MNTDIIAKILVVFAKLEIVTDLLDTAVVQVVMKTSFLPFVLNNIKN